MASLNGDRVRFSNGAEEEPEPSPVESLPDDGDADGPVVGPPNKSDLASTAE